MSGKMKREKGQQAEPTMTSEGAPPASAPQVVKMRCPICSCAGEAGDDGPARCEACGVSFLRMRPALGELTAERGTLFEHSFATANGPAVIAAKRDAQVVMQGYWGIRKGKAVALNAFGLSAFEVNCGLGHRLRAMAGYGWDVAGVEVSAVAFEYAKRLSLDVIRGWLTDADLGNRRFDLAIFHGSFGQMPEATRAVESLHASLKIGALVCVQDEPIDPKAGRDVGRIAWYSPDALKRVFCDYRYAFIREEFGEDGRGTYWFEAIARR